MQHLHASPYGIPPWKEIDDFAMLPNGGHLYGRHYLPALHEGSLALATASRMPEAYARKKGSPPTGQ
jgi:hypothetical protein